MPDSGPAAAAEAKSAPVAAAATSVSQALPKVTIRDLDPSKFGIKSFSSLFADLEEEQEVTVSPSMSHARDIILKGEELRSLAMQERQKREEVEKKLEQTNLDDLDKELEELDDDELSDADLDDSDFAAVGGKYVRKVRVDSDDDSSDD